MSEPAFLQLYEADAQGVRDELSRALRAPAVTLSPKFLYDRLGSCLFDAITALDEYYPTRTEAAILSRHQAEMAAWCGSGHPLIDLGAGSCAKAPGLFPTFQPRQYVAVDISVDFLREALGRLQREHPALPMLGVGMDFSRHLQLPPAVAAGPRNLFYPGSSIGNFAPDEALVFLRQVHVACAGGALLIGVDLVKPVPVLEAAYDDALGVTAAFNLNLLRHLNGLLGTDFDPRQWQHHALFNRDRSRIEMHLASRTDQTVRWPGGERVFTQGERMHTESSYKYRVRDFSALLHDAGFRDTRCWTDDQDWFAVFAARA